MKRVLYLLFVLCMAFVITTSASARHIIWVSDCVDEAEGERHDQGFINLLTDAGYEVTRFATPKELDSQAKLDELNAADLVILGRHGSSGDYANDVSINNQTINEATLWNSLTVPIINCNAYLWRSNRFKWLSSDATNNTSFNLKIVVTDDPIFEGITPDINNEILIINGGEERSALAMTNSAGNGQLLGYRAADNAADQHVWIARWETGTEFYNGCGEYANGPRMAFGCGVSGGAGDGIFNLNEAGTKIFLNAVALYAPLTDKAHNPTPQADEIQVAIDTTFSWNTALDDATGQARTDVINHILYIGAPNEPNAASSTPIVITNDGSGMGSYTPAAPLERDAVYKWRVDQELSDSTIIEGITWTFESIPSVPVIDVQPTFDTLVDVDGTFELSVEATNPFTGDATGLEYQWYLNGSEVGADNATYSVTAAELTDEGEYYCVVKITSNGATTQSDSGKVFVKRLVQYHAFDGDLVDAAGINDGIYGTINDPNANEAVFDTGFLGQAVSFDGSSYVSISAQGHPRAGSSLEHSTISAWIKTGVSEGNIIGNFNNLPQNSTTGFQFHVTGGDLRCYVRDLTDTSIEYRNGQVANDEWHHVVVTWYTNLEGGEMALYVDGKQTGSFSKADVYELYGDWIYDMAIGARNNRGAIDGFFTGLIDELKVYNYPMTATEVAVEYNSYTGLDTCVTRPELDLTGPGPEDSDGDGIFDPDCKVNLYDVQLFIQSWMECGLVPACL